MRRSNPCTLFALAALAALPALAAPQSQTQPAAPQAPAASAPAAQPPGAFDPSKSDEKAVAIADQVIAAMGGQAAWDKLRFVKLTFAVKQGEKRLGVRTHYWDKHGRRSRMEGPTKEGKSLVAVVDHATRQGQAAVDGQLLFEADSKKYVDLAYGNLINDTYWLFMPFKMKDPGVRLRYEGGVPENKPIYDKIMLSFDDGTGLTSKDRYWLYVNRTDHMIERWSYVLQGQGQSASPTAWQWVDWTTVGGLKVSTRRTQDGGEVDIVLENVEALDTLPETVFTTTAPVGAEPAAPAPEQPAAASTAPPATPASPPAP
jgi:hypothetical protein